MQVTEELVPVKPLLRGWMHLVCFFLAIPAGVIVVALAQSPRGRIAALVYAVGLIALFGVSGTYHRLDWSATKRLWMQKLDHGTIFVMIAGSYTPVCLLVLQGWVAWTMLAVAWTGAAIGFVLAFSRGRATRIARSALYICLGWVSVVAIPQMWSHMSVAELVLHRGRRAAVHRRQRLPAHQLARPVPAGLRVPRGLAPAGRGRRRVPLRRHLLGGCVICVRWQPHAGAERTQIMG